MFFILLKTNVLLASKVNRLIQAPTGNNASFLCLGSLIAVLNVDLLPLLNIKMQLLTILSMLLFKDTMLSFQILKFLVLKSSCVISHPICSYVHSLNICLTSFLLFDGKLYFFSPSLGIDVLFVFHLFEGQGLGKQVPFLHSPDLWLVFELAFLFCYVACWLAK